MKKLFELNYAGTDWVETTEVRNRIPIYLYDKIDGKMVIKGVGLYGDILNESEIKNMPPNIVCVTYGFRNYHCMREVYTVKYAGDNMYFWSNK